MAVTAGTLLRRAREAAGLHVAALAVSLKVPVRKLEALESDRYDLLPDAVFVRALASSVCRTLKIDPQPVLDRLPQTAAPRLVQRQRRHQRAVPRAQRRRRRRAGCEQLSKPVFLAVFAPAARRAGADPAARACSRRTAQPQPAEAARPRSPRAGSRRGCRAASGRPRPPPAAIGRAGRGRRACRLRRRSPAPRRSLRSARRPCGGCRAAAEPAPAAVRRQRHRLFRTKASVLGRSDRRQGRGRRAQADGGRRSRRAPPARCRCRSRSAGSTPPKSRCAASRSTCGRCRRTTWPVSR